MNMATATTAGKRSYRMDLRARRQEETAERIRAASLELFVSRPYDEVTLADVAEAAGVTVPTLIAHFGRKEDLFLAACRDKAREIAQSRDLAPAGDHAGAVRNVIAHYEENGASVLHLLAEEDRFPAVRRITDAGRLYHRSWVARVFEPALARRAVERRERLRVQLVVATDLLSWKLMRHDMGLPRRRVEEAMLGTVEALTGSG